MKSQQEEAASLKARSSVLTVARQDCTDEGFKYSLWYQCPSVSVLGAQRSDSTEYQ